MFQGRDQYENHGGDHICRAPRSETAQTIRSAARTASTSDPASAANTGTEARARAPVFFGAWFLFSVGDRKADTGILNGARTTSTTYRREESIFSNWGIRARGTQ